MKKDLHPQEVLLLYLLYLLLLLLRNLSFTEFMIFLRNSSFLTLSGLFAVISQTWNEFSITSG